MKAPPAEQLGHLAVGLGEGGLVDAGADAEAVALLERAELPVRARLDDEDALATTRGAPASMSRARTTCDGLVGVDGADRDRGRGEAVLRVERADAGADLGERRRR